MKLSTSQMATLTFLRFAKSSTTSRTICSMHISHVIRARVACASARLGCFIVTVGDWALQEYPEIGHCSEGLRHCTETVESLGCAEPGYSETGRCKDILRLGARQENLGDGGSSETLEQLHTFFSEVTHKASFGPLWGHSAVGHLGSSSAAGHCRIFCSRAPQGYSIRIASPGHCKDIAHC